MNLDVVGVLTDGIGEYRVFRLDTGEICVSPKHTYIFASVEEMIGYMPDDWKYTPYKEMN